MNEIQTVKIQSNGWLLNGTMSVPDAVGNRERELIKQWLSEGNTPEPEFTDEELVQQELDKQVSEAKSHLALTDFKMTIDYFATMTTEQQEALVASRAEARAFLKANGY